MVTGALSRYGSHMKKIEDKQSASPRVRTRKSLTNRFASAVLVALLSSMVLAPIAHVSAQSKTDTIITRSVIAEEGDTLRSIARREFGKSGLSNMLANFNGMQESDALAAGQIIRIPLFTPVDRQFATVIFAKGVVTKNDEQVKRDDKIYLHELLKTGDDGFASLEFASGSVINLQPKTHAKLERLNCLDSDASCLIVLDSAQGEVSSDVKRREGQPTEFTIKTPYASAAVRGTVFEMNAQSAEIIVGVTEGEVLLQGATRGVPLDEGFGSVAAANRPPLDPIALLPAPVYRYIPTRAAKGDTVSWWALSDVQQYQIDLTADEGGMDVIANYNESAGILSIEDLDAGDYFLNVRGIDSNGLKGYKAPTKLKVASIDESVEPVNTSVSRNGNEFLVKVIDPPETSPGYEIQISRTEDFSDPLSVDIENPGTAIFRLESDKIFTRARVLLDPSSVSAFGDISESN